MRCGGHLASPPLDSHRYPRACKRWAAPCQARVPHDWQMMWPFPSANSLAPSCQAPTHTPHNTRPPPPRTSSLRHMRRRITRHRGCPGQTARHAWLTAMKNASKRCSGHSASMSAFCRCLSHSRCTHRQIGRQAGRRALKEAGTQAGRLTGVERGRQPGRQAGRRAGRQALREAANQAGGQAGKH
eukprot:360679-Chlamydomonas_euryale.AAC.2